jgi:phosphatidylethanolamine-binding protein (PEBP) family uncharacterized protein
MRLISTAFSDGATIPRRFTCDGEDVSPALQWFDAPAQTKSFVLLCDDPDAPDMKEATCALLQSTGGMQSREFLCWR